MVIASFDAAERKRLWEHGGGVLVVAALCGAVAYLGCEFVAGVTGRTINSRAIAEEVASYLIGIGIVVALIHLTVT